MSRTSAVEAYFAEKNPNFSAELQVYLAAKWDRAVPLIHKVNFYFFLSGDCSLRPSTVLWPSAFADVPLPARCPVPAPAGCGLANSGCAGWGAPARHPRYTPTAAQTPTPAHGSRSPGWPKDSPTLPPGLCLLRDGPERAGEAGAVLHQPPAGASPASLPSRSIFN